MRLKRIHIRAPAKINLVLEVLGKRPNGYHGIRSLIARISLYDDIRIESARGGVETVMDVSRIPAPGEHADPGAGGNIAGRAAAAMKKAIGYRGGARISIRKGIPICGGLGGGSADAAAVLHGLNRLWGAGLGLDDLLAIGKDLGSDVPAMIHGGAVLTGGTGEKVAPVGMPSRRRGEWWVLIVNPGFGIRTREVCSRYSSVLTCRRGQLRKMIRAMAEWDRGRAAPNLFNSLEPTVFSKYPLLAIMSEELVEQGARGALLCGSGSSLFALADDFSHARSIAGGICRAMGSWPWRRIAKVLPDGVTVAHGPLEARV